MIFQVYLFGFQQNCQRIWSMKISASPRLGMQTWPRCSSSSGLKESSSECCEELETPVKTSTMSTMFFKLFQLQLARTSAAHHGPGAIASSSLSLVAMALTRAPCNWPRREALSRGMGLSCTRPHSNWAWVANCRIRKVTPKSCDICDYDILWLGDIRSFTMKIVSPQFVDGPNWLDLLPRSWSRSIMSVHWRGSQQQKTMDQKPRRLCSPLNKDTENQVFHSKLSIVYGVLSGGHPQKVVSFAIVRRAFPDFPFE